MLFNGRAWFGRRLLRVGRRRRTQLSACGLRLANDPLRFLYSTGGRPMIRRTMMALLCAGALTMVFGAEEAKAQDAYNRQWGRTYSTQDWNRMYHYPYVWYPQNFWGEDYYRSSESLYYRYPPEMRIPVYNRQWQNYYPQNRRYYSGHHFQLDVF